MLLFLLASSMFTCGFSCSFSSSVSPSSEVRELASYINKSVDFILSVVSSLKLLSSCSLIVEILGFISCFFSSNFSSCIVLDFSEDVILTFFNSSSKFFIVSSAWVNF
jgi:hypothetical protein